MREQIRAEASDWVLRLEEDGGEAARAAFSEWMTRSPDHVEAFLAVSVAARALEQVPADLFDTDALIAAARADGDEEEGGNVVVLPLGIVPTPAKPVWWKRPGPLAAAASLLVAAAIGGVGLRQALVPDHYVTAANESRAITLSDGSVVELDHESAIDLHWTPSERRIELRKGSGRFTVAKNPQRPFIVATAETTVRAVGTVFSVQAQSADTVVTVSEGKVKVEPSYAEPAAAKAAEPPVQLAAGDRAVVSHRARHDVSVTAWADQRLVFRGAALEAVIGEFNQHVPVKLVLADAGLADLAISGVFDPSDVESFLQYLERYEGVRIGRQPDGTVRMTAGTRPIK